jgi:hypothetical protein
MQGSELAGEALRQSREWREREARAVTRRALSSSVGSESRAVVFGDDPFSVGPYYSCVALELVAPRRGDGSEAEVGAALVPPAPRDGSTASSSSRRHCFFSGS